MSSDLNRINHLLNHVDAPWAAGLLRAMRRNVMDGRELMEMHRAALSRMERKFLSGTPITDETALHLPEKTGKAE